MQKIVTVYRLNDRAVAAFGDIAFRGDFSTATSDNSIVDYFNGLVANDQRTCYGGVRIEIQNSNRIA